MISQIDLSTYLDLFTGHKDFYGVHVYKNHEKGEKEKGDSFTKNQPINQNLYKEHLEGKQGLGIIPIDSNNNVRFMVFDIDKIGIPIKPFLTINNEYELPFNFFRSKSGGLHIYIFFNEDVKAKKGLEYMEKYLHIFGLERDTEIFPKQSRLLKNQKGNWINLPYYNCTKPKQFLYDEQGNALSSSSAMLYLKKRTINFNQFKESYENLPYNDAPICLQSLLIHQKISNRNMFLFDIATYYKAKGDDYEYQVAKVNQTLPEPLPEKELFTTVIKSQQKRTYSYRCKETPMCDNCNKELCLKREFGYGGDTVSKLSFENLVQVKADSPYYKWTVNGIVMTFYSEAELRDQSKFTDYCMRELHVVPNQLRRDRWYKILEDAFKEIVIEEIDQDDDISAGAMFVSYLKEFLLDRSYAKTKQQITMNRVYKDDELLEFVFRKETLIQFFFVQKNFRYFSITEIQDRVKKIGAKPKKYYCGKSITVRAWVIPFSFVQDQIDERNINEVVDFSKYKEEEIF